MHILLIEDDNDAASYVIKGLKESGHVVDRASDGEEGLYMALDSNFDVLVNIVRIFSFWIFDNEEKVLLKKE